VFVELMPMLAGRTVMITVAREDDKTLRLHIIPKKVKDDENPALSTPLSYTGTPEELDAELGKHAASISAILPSPTSQSRSKSFAAAPPSFEARALSSRPKGLSRKPGLA
jgi:PRTRC genetic system protein E